MARRFGLGIILLGTLVLLVASVFIATELLGVPDRFQAPIAGYTMATGVLIILVRRRWNRSRRPGSTPQ